MIYFQVFLFLSYSFGVEKTNTFIRSRGSPENHTRLQTIMVKIYTHFQTKTAQKTILYGAAHTYIADLGEYPLPRGNRKVLLSSFHLNDRTLGFSPRTQKLEPPCTA